MNRVLSFGLKSLWGKLLNSRYGLVVVGTVNLCELPYRHKLTVPS